MAKLLLLLSLSVSFTLFGAPISEFRPSPVSETALTFTDTGLIDLSRPVGLSSRSDDSGLVLRVPQQISAVWHEIAEITSSIRAPEREASLLLGLSVTGLAFLWRRRYPA